MNPYPTPELTADEIALALMPRAERRREQKAAADAARKAERAHLQKPSKASRGAFVTLSTQPTFQQAYATLRRSGHGAAGATAEARAQSLRATVVTYDRTAGKEISRASHYVGTRKSRLAHSNRHAG